MSKTYVPGLRVVLEAAYKYGTRWQQQLATSLTAEQLACLQTTVTALAACLQLLGSQSVNP